jgi:hypothetical protein
VCVCARACVCDFMCVCVWGGVVCVCVCDSVCACVRARVWCWCLSVCDVCLSVCLSASLSLCGVCVWGAEGWRVGNGWGRGSRFVMKTGDVNGVEWEGKGENGE